MDHTSVDCRPTLQAETALEIKEDNVPMEIEAAHGLSVQEEDKPAAAHSSAARVPQTGSQKQQVEVEHLIAGTSSEASKNISTPQFQVKSAAQVYVCVCPLAASIQLMSFLKVLKLGNLNFSSNAWTPTMLLSV